MSLTIGIRVFLQKRPYRKTIRIMGLPDILPFISPVMFLQKGPQGFLQFVRALCDLGSQRRFQDDPLLCLVVMLCAENDENCTGLSSGRCGEWESMPSKKTSSASGGHTRSQYSHFPTSSRTCFFVFVERAMRLRLGMLRSDAKSLVICPSLQDPAFFPGHEAGEDLLAST